jgi:uncharacterized protein YjbI with pentapeptide repeats
MRTEMDRINYPYEHPPFWYSSSTGGVNLQGANFTEAILQKALLWRGDFTGTVFRKANLQKADLGVSILAASDLTEANLENAILARADLRDANLSRARLINADIRDVDLTQVMSLVGVYLSGANLNNTMIRREQLQHGLGEEKDGDYYGAKEAYLTLKINFLSLGRYDDASWAFVKERKMERKANNPFRARRYYGKLELLEPTRFFTGENLFFMIRHTNKWIFDWINELLCGYGEMPLRVVFWALVTIVAFPFFYFLSGGISTTNEIPPTWLDYLQYSLAAFSTINVADIEATNNYAKLLTSVEALLGISIVALLMFALGNRISKS